MKKLYVSALALLICTSLSVAQSFTASNIYVSGNPLFQMEGHATITNTSSTSKDVLVQRTVNNLFSGHISYFCWFECYTEIVSLSPDVVTIDAGTSTSVFRAYLETSAIPGISMSSYCFFDANNTSDSVCVEYLFDATTGLIDIPSSKNYISKPYPNPASEITNFYVNVLKGSKNARIKVFNMLGAEVKEIAIPENKNTLKINVSDLKSGIYFYSLWVNGKSTGTGKLMVSKD
jgi:hypothetical protein